MSIKRKAILEILTDGKLLLTIEYGDKTYQGQAFSEEAKELTELFKSKDPKKIWQKLIEYIEKS